MKEHIRKDVGEYFFDRTNDFEISPPEHIWENIRKEIAVPQIPARPHLLRFWQYYAISAIIAVIAVYTYTNLDSSDISSIKISENTVVTNSETSESVQPIDNSASTVIKDANKNEVVVNNSELIVAQKKEEVAKLASAKVIEKLSSNKNAEITNTTNEIKANVSNPTVISSVKKYNISASTFKNVKQILFVNDSGEKSLVISNPSVNKFGFFEIDVTNLSSGRYKIKVLTDKEEIEHKIENF